MDSRFHWLGILGVEVTSCNPPYTDGKVQVSNADCKFRRKHATDHQ